MYTVKSNTGMQFVSTARQGDYNVVFPAGPKVIGEHIVESFASCPTILMELRNNIM